MFFKREKSLSSAGKCSSKWKNLFRVRENVLRIWKNLFRVRENLFRIKEKSLSSAGKCSSNMEKSLSSTGKSLANIGKSQFKARFMGETSFCFIVDIAANTRESLLLAMEMPKSVGDYSKKEFIRKNCKQIKMSPLS